MRTSPRRDSEGRRRPLPVAALALCALALSASPAAAAEEGEAQRSEAKALLGLGATAYESGDYASALQHFVDAHRLYSSPKIYFNIGQAAVHLGRTAEAAEAFDAFLTNTALDAKTDFSKKEEASNTLAKLARSLARVTLEVSPDTARVTVDNRAVTAGPVYLLLAPSEHVFEVSADGFQPLRQHVSTPTAGKTGIVVRLHLVATGAAPAPSAPAPAAPVALAPAVSAAPLVVRTDSPTSPPAPAVAPAAKPAGTSDVPPATPKVLLAQADSSPSPATSVAAAGAASSEPSRLPAYIAWGAGGVLAVLGTYFGLTALSVGQTIGKESTAAQCDNAKATGYDPTRCPNWSTDALAADLLFGGAVAAGAAGGVLFFVAPSLSGSGGEVMVNGRF